MNTCTLHDQNEIYNLNHMTEGARKLKKKYCNKILPVITLFPLKVI